MRCGLRVAELEALLDARTQTIVGLGARLAEMQGDAPPAVSDRVRPLEAELAELACHEGAAVQLGATALVRTFARRPWLRPNAWGRRRSRTAHPNPRRAWIPIGAVAELEAELEASLTLARAQLGLIRSSLATVATYLARSATILRDPAQ